MDISKFFKNKKNIIYILTTLTVFIILIVFLFISPINSSAINLKYGIEAFPESYKPYLYELQKKYPNWNFTALYTELDWNYVIDNENRFGVNLVPLSYSDSWKNTEPDKYNVEVDKGWVDSSRQSVEYSMDPRNFLNEVRIFQFEQLSFDSKTNSISSIEKILYGTEFYDRIVEYYDYSGNKIVTTDKYSKLILDAASSTNVSSNHLASRIRQEVGPFLSHSSISGLVSGYTGLYNFYNIGATSSPEPMGAIINGLKYARNGNGASQSTQDKYMIPWNTKATSISGGATFIGSSYISLGQDTIYLQKFHVSQNTPGDLFWHQYMTNVLAPYSESSSIYKGYLNSNLLSGEFSFVIPVYDNMPEFATESPNINPNDYTDDDTKVFANVSTTLNIRSLPSSSSEILTTVTSSDIFTRIKKGRQSGDLWDKVILSNGIVGYAFASYIEELPNIQIESVSISLDSTTFNVGDSQKLDVEILPVDAKNNEISFESSNLNIASVSSDGNILALAPGNCKIKVVSKENTGVYDEIDITIISPVTDIYLPNSDVILNIEDRFNLNASVLPSNASNKGISYVSSDSGIVSVDNLGNLIPIATGSANITVSSDDGNIKKTVSVLVIEPIPEEDLSFDESLDIQNNLISGFDYLDMNANTIKSLITTIYNVEIYDKDNNIISDNGLVGTGSKIKILDENNIVISQYLVVLYGDVNGDSKIDSIDLLVLQRHILELDKLTNSFIVAGNINKNNNNPSSLDSLLIQRHILDLQIISQDIL